MAKKEYESIEALERKIAADRAKLARKKAKIRSEAERKKTRKKIIVGAALLTHAASNPGFAETLVSTLNRAIVDKRDKEFLTEILAGNLTEFAKGDG